MAREMTMQAATETLIAFLVDPANNYTWWEARNSRRVIADYVEALLNRESDARILEASRLADWAAVMRSLVALKRIHYPGA